MKWWRRERPEENFEVVYEWVKPPPDWVVVSFDHIDVTFGPDREQQYVPGPVTFVDVVPAKSKDEAIRRVIGSGGFYDAFPMPEVHPQEYRLRSVE